MIKNSKHLVEKILIMKKSFSTFLVEGWPMAKKNLELIFWPTSLLLLVLMDPQSNSHFSLCIFKFIGLSFCPGCGLGHSISFLFHGNITASLHAHILGIPAVIIILIRIFKLSFRSFNNYKNHLTCN